MAWYRAGSATVTNGSAVVTGAGTAWVANVQAGHALNLPDGRAYEVLSVDSNTQITLGSPYLGGSAGGQPYSVQPNQGFAQAAATRLSDFLSQIQGWVSGVLAGRFGDGSLVAPGISFAADQDTGFRRIAENVLSLVTGGSDRITVDAGGNVGLGTTSPLSRLAVYLVNAGKTAIVSGQIPGATGSGISSIVEATSPAAVGLSFETYKQNVGPIEAARFDHAGNLLVGVTSSLLGAHTITKAVAAGMPIASFYSPTTNMRSLVLYAAGNDSWPSAGCVMGVGRDTTTGRSINAVGTINASGADYAEYLTKAEGCGAIAKGDVCGVDRDGLLTRTWSDAVRFVVKSTDPNLVGGDTWASHLPPQPEAPADAPIAPITPAPSASALPVEPVREEGEDDDSFIYRRVAYLIALSAATNAASADRDALAAYHAALEAYPAAKAEHDAAVATYEVALSAWEADLEAARQTVDRIAFCGQVPVNVNTATLAACGAALADGVAVYLVAVARGAGIGVTAVRESDMTLQQYMRRIGAVWAIREGRPWVDVQHG